MKGITRVRDALFTSSGHQFQALVAVMLDGLVENFSASKALGLLDRFGIDAYAYRNADDSFKLIVQCKGFELLEYGTKQHSQCRAEVKKFAEKGLRCDEYWLILNKSIKDKEMRNELIGDLSLLEASKMTRKAILLDLDHFLMKLKELASACLLAWAERRRLEYFEYYAERMVFVDYIADVPCNISDTPKQNPVSLMLSNINRFLEAVPQTQAGKFRAAPKYLIKSGFGFGKTSSLQALAREWLNEGKHLVYAPAALLDERAFSNSSGLAGSLLQLLLPDDENPNDIVSGMLRDSLKHNLATSKDWLLLVDGLDENPSAFRANSLTALWGSIKDLGLPAVLSAREELVDGRLGELDASKSKTQFDEIELVEWSDKLILRFLDEFATRRNLPAPQSFQELIELVSQGQYEDIYGDIPKRPLFLGMLAADAWADRKPEKELHRLYGRYFRQKFQFDRSSTSAGGASKRPSAIVDEFGHDEATERLIRVMQDASGHMTVIPNNWNGKESAELFVQIDTIKEDELRAVAEKNGVKTFQLEDLVMHSLLQYGGRDRTTRERLCRFAHRSYQDWFLARFLASNGCAKIHNIPLSVARFHNPMIRDLANGDPLP